MIKSISVVYISSLINNSVGFRIMREQFVYVSPTSEQCGLRCVGEIFISEWTVYSCLALWLNRVIYVNWNTSTTLIPWPYSEGGWGQRATLEIYEGKIHAQCYEQSHVPLPVTDTHNNKSNSVLHFSSPYLRLMVSKMGAHIAITTNAMARYQICFTSERFVWRSPQSHLTRLCSYNLLIPYAIYSN